MLIDLPKLVSEQQLSVRGVIHVGAHYGQEVPTYISMGAREIALFEPLGEHIRVLARKVTAWQQDPHSPRIDFFQLALGTVHSQHSMTIANNQGQSSSLLKPKEHLTLHPQVRFDRSETVCVSRMDRIITQPHRYNLLCIDVQGYELKVLKGAGQAILSQMDVVYCEVNRGEVYEGNSLVTEVDAYLQTFGFERVVTQWSGEIWGDAVYVKPQRTAAPRRQITARALTEQQGDQHRLYHQHGIDADLAQGRKLIPTVNMHDRCTFLPEAPAATAERSETRLDAIKIVRMGRYSNNIIQLLHATVLAETMGIEKLVLPANFAQLPGINLRIGGIHIMQEGTPGADSGLQLASYCWFPSGSLRRCFATISSRQAHNAAIRVVKPLFFQHFPFPSPPPSALDAQPSRLVAHLRSGDLFRHPEQKQPSRLPHPFYVQPPLSFYQLAIEQALSGKAAPAGVQLVIEDRNNPVVCALIDWLQAKTIPFSIMDGDFQDAIETMLNARAIVSAYGSVIEMIGMLSDVLEEVYCFRGYGRWAEQGFGGHGRYELLGNIRTIHTLELEGEYIQAGEWKDTTQQRELMINYQASPAALRELSIDLQLEADRPFFMVA